MPLQAEEARKTVVTSTAITRRWRALPPLAVAGLVLGLGLLLTLAASLFLLRREQQDASDRFERLSERVERELHRRLQLPVYGLHGARGVYAASREVRREEFRAYVDSRHLATEFPGIRGFGFIERVMRADLAKFVAEVRADQSSDFELRTQGDAADLLVVKYIEPLAANRAAWGLDIGGMPGRREVVEQAVRRGEATLSGRLVLLQDEQQSPGFLLMVPVYRQGSDPQTEAQRWRALLGLVYVPIVARELLAGLAEVAEGQLDLEVYTDARARPEDFLYGAPNAASAAAGATSARPLFSREHSLNFGGRELVVRTRTRAEFERRQLGHGAAWLGVGGSLLSLLLSLAAWLLASGRARAEALARAMTADLERLAHVARGTTNAVIATDTELRINWVNEGFSRISGYSAAEAMGRTPGELLGSGLARPEVLRTLEESAKAGVGCRVEILNRRKDGSLYWVDTELQPLRDAQGRLSGFIEIALEITDSKHAAELLWQERERLNNIIEGTQAGTWEWNAQTGELRLNERWAGMLGYTLADLAPLSVDILARLCHPEDLPRAELLLQRHLRGESSHYETELRLRHRHGHWVWVLTQGKLFAFGANGEPLWVAGTHLDISQRKRMEEELRASEAVLERAGRIAGVGGWQVDLRDMQLHWTAQTFRIHDLTPQQQQPSLEAALEFYDLAGRLAIRAAVRRAFKQRESADLELRMTTALGRFIWVRAVGEPEFEGDRVVRFVGTLQDITERRELEDSMRRSNEVLRSVLDSLPCGLSVFDAELNLVACNDQYRSLLDLPDALFAGQEHGRPANFEEITRFNAARGEYGEGAAAEAIVKELIQRARAPDRHEYGRLRPNGLALEIRGGPMPGGGFVTTYNDVTAQRRAAAELAQTLAMLRAVLDAASKVAIIATDRKRCISVFNQGAQQMLGYTPDEMVGRQTSRALLDPQELEAFGRAVSRLTGEQMDGFAAMVHPSQLGQEIECHYVRKDGSRFPALRVVTEMRGVDGGVFGYLGVSYDITRQKENEASLQEARAVAEQASAAKSQFLANMSHEIRTPMNAILGMLKLLGRTALDVKQRDYAAKAEGAARSLLGLLNDILDFSKIEAGKMELDPQPCHPARLLEDLQVILRANLGAKALQLQFELDPVLPACVLADAMRLQQVLINLGGNAIKFTAAGAVRVSLRQQACTEGQVLLEFRVSDTGIGIAPEHQDKIFAGFTQAEASTTRRFGGTGLGLVISQRLVQLMGGQLQLRSAVGQGSDFFFTLRLPVLDAAAALPVIEAPAEMPAQRLLGLRLLVAEDNPNNQQVALELLQDEGAQVVLAGDGQQAVDLLAGSGPFDAVLMDVQMPVMDGYAATREIRGRLGLRTLPVIAMTANAMASDLEACRAAGMDEHVGKPFELDHLVAVLLRRAGRSSAVAAVAATTATAGALVSEALQRRARAGGLDLRGALQRLMGKTALLERMSQSFVPSAEGLPGQLRAHLLADELEPAAAALHGFKGLAATLGADRLAELASLGEQRLRRDERLEPAWLDSLEQAIASGSRLLLELSAGLHKVEAPAVPGGPLDETAARADLQALVMLLRRSDLAALEALERLRRAHGGGLPVLEELAEAMARLDFAAALQYCEQMLGELS